nr:ABC transporter permease [Methylomarinum sp. Ch1-1]MDP4520831.1 ABC transporter permease [Methylomarinum sp. Ch1-1]
MHRLLLSAAGLAVLLLMSSAALVLWTDQAVLPGLISIFLMLFGFALLMPSATYGLMRLLEKALPQTSGVLIRLPARMVRAEISRTGLAIATLMIAVAAAIGMDLMIGSFRQTVSDWLQTSLRADLYVSVAGNDEAADKARQDRRLRDQLAALPDVARLSSVLRTQLFVGEQRTRVSVFELNEQAKQGFIFKQQIPDVWKAFNRQDTIFVTEPYAYHHHVHLGDKLKLRTADGEQTVKVIAIYADYSGDQGHLTMSRDIYRQYWPDLGYSGIGIYARPEADRQQLEARINALLKPYQTVNSEKAIYRTSMQMFARTFKITETLRWLAATIAFIGVFSALMALQFERTRQLGVLRAIGMTPWQIARLIATETGLLGLLAGLMALPVGLLMAYVLITVVYKRSFGWTLTLHWDAQVLAQGMLLALMAALLAGVLPAIKMARTRPAEALRNE